MDRVETLRIEQTSTNEREEDRDKARRKNQAMAHK